MLKEAYRLHRNRPDVPDRYYNIVVLCRFARALALEGQPVEAARLLACSEVLFEELGVVVGSWITKLLNEPTLALIHAQLDEAAFEQAREEGRRLSADEAAALALDLLE